MNYFSNTYMLTAIKKKKLLLVEHGLQTKNYLQLNWGTMEKFQTAT